MKTFRGAVQAAFGLVIVAALILVLVLAFRSVSGGTGAAPAATAGPVTGYPAPAQTQSGYPAPGATPVPGMTVPPEITLAVLPKNPTPWLTFTPPPQPTVRPGPSETPLPPVKPAPDSAGVIVYASIGHIDAQASMSDITLSSQQIDGSGQPQSAPVKVDVGSISGYQIFPSPDGSRVAIVKGAEAGDSVNIVNMGSGQVEPLFKTLTISGGRFLGWHPDGRHVLYDAIDSGPDSGLWLVDVDTEQLTILVRDPEGADAIHGAAVSPNGQSIIYTYWRGFGSTAELRMINSDGSEPQVLRSSPTDPGAISWSPDGRMIAIMADGGLAAMDLATRALTTYPDAYGPAIWSPDSQRIAYVYADVTADQKGQPPDSFRGRTIHVIDIATAKDQPLINEVGDIDPTWSPDGSRLAFASMRGGMPGIWVVDAVSTNLHQVAQGGQVMRFPVWLRAIAP